MRRLRLSIRDWRLRIGLFRSEEDYPQIPQITQIRKGIEPQSVIGISISENSNQRVVKSERRICPSIPSQYPEPDTKQLALSYSS